MSDPQFFGYGSLVNLRTHDYANPRPATLQGWKRVWQPSKIRHVAFLSVLPCASSEIDGVIATVPDGDWTSLDAREHSYDRKDVTETLGQAIPTAIYQGSPSSIATDDVPRPILLSYLDVVGQGYINQFGEVGLARFFDTTERWDTPILNDRANPIYPRHQETSVTERKLIDDHLSRLSTVVKQTM